MDKRFVSMKILWLSHLIPYPPKGGVLQRSYHLLRELSKSHEVELMAFNQESLIGPLYKGDVELGVEDARRALSEHCSGVSFFEIEREKRPYGKYRLAVESLLNGAPYTINWLRAREFSSFLSRVVKENEFDLVHVDTISLDIYRPLLGDIPCVLDHHNIESHMLLRRSKQEKSLVKKTYFYQEGIRLEKFERKVCPKYTGHITCSDVDTARLETLTPGSSIKTIPNGVDTAYFRPKGLSQEPKTLIFVGTMGWYPNIEAVNYVCDEIMPILRERSSGIKFRIIGANPPESIRKLAETYDDIEVLGFVDDVRDYIERASVYVCPIMDGGGTKLKILDALAMKKAIVAHSIACEGINVTDGVNVLLADTGEEYATAILRLLQNDTLRRDLGQEARTLAVEQYDYASIGSSLSAYYTSLVEN